jgi:hypothetical protein
MTKQNQDDFIDVEVCAWNKCKQLSTEIWYGLGLCEKHIAALIKEWHSNDKTTVPSVLKKKCSKLKKYIKEID